MFIIPQENFKIWWNCQNLDEKMSYHPHVAFSLQYLSWKLEENQILKLIGTSGFELGCHAVVTNVVDESVIFPNKWYAGV